MNQIPCLRSDTLYLTFTDFEINDFIIDYPSCSDKLNLDPPNFIPEKDWICPACAFCKFEEASYTDSEKLKRLNQCLTRIASKISLVSIKLLECGTNQIF